MNALAEISTFSETGRHIVKQIQIALSECTLPRTYEQIKSTENELKSNVSSLGAILRPELEQTRIYSRNWKSRMFAQFPCLFFLVCSNTVDQPSQGPTGVSNDGRIVIEVDAGRATANFVLLKDIFQASMMHGVGFLILAVRNDYRGGDDFQKVYTFLETLYISSRLVLPLKGIILIGY